MLENLTDKSGITGISSSLCNMTVGAEPAFGDRGYRRQDGLCSYGFVVHDEVLKIPVTAPI